MSTQPSYSSHNIHEFNELYASLIDSGFDKDDIWFDRDAIRLGDEWRSTIDEALQDAFVILLLVTRESMDSHPVTYEWAWAIGHGTPVISVIFDEGVIRDQLKGRQYVSNWKDGKDILIRDLKYLQRETPTARYTQLSINQEIHRARILMDVVLWLYDYAFIGTVDIDTFHRLFHAAFMEINNVYSEKLPRFWLQYSHAIRYKDRRKIEDLIQNLSEFWHRINHLESITGNSANDGIPLQTFFNRYKVDIPNIEDLCTYWDENVLSILDEIDRQLPYLLTRTRLTKIVERSEKNVVPNLTDGLILHFTGKFLTEEELLLLQNAIEQVKNHIGSINQ